MLAENERESIERKSADMILQYMWTERINRKNDMLHGKARLLIGDRGQVPADNHSNRLI